MIKAIICPVLSAALEKLKEIVTANERDGKQTVVFCEDRLTLAAERTVCAAVGGTFSVSVYTFARFLASERGRGQNVLSSQGSAMAIRRIIEENRDKLKLFGKFSAASAAAAVYDTIALLYSSKISAEDVAHASARGLLESKLHDIALIYSAYNEYLEKSGKTDRNAYLCELPEVISGSGKIAASEVVFLGFQSFTRASSECVRASFGTARGTYGLFIGGEEEVYVNEASLSFLAAAEDFGGAECERVESSLKAEAELLRRSLFEPDSFYGEGLPTSDVHVFEAADGEEELEFIAASIKKHVLDYNERYAKISVMLPDVKGAERDLCRVFSQYAIPYYADRRHALSEHPVCDFIINYLNCAAGNCAFRDTDGVISSPFFTVTRADKDEYRNYALRLAVFRGGVRREPDPQILKAMNFNYDAVQRVRKTFLDGLACIPAKGGAGEVLGGVRKLLELFSAEEKLKDLSDKFKDSYPTESEFCGRVYDAVLSVLAEAESVAGGSPMPLKEIIKILKSGFGALEISLIPPKSDAVFVGDIAATANTGTDVVFAARLTDGVPDAGSDTALLSDREISELEKVSLEISPKIRQVNMRRRETTALNICSFRKQLYLSYPVRLGGEECGPSEIISYAAAVFRSPSGGALKALNLKKIEKSERALPYYCCEKIPALKRLSSSYRPEAVSAVYGVLKARGLEEAAQSAVAPPRARTVSDGRALFVSYNSVSPTVLETYFSCPYRNFMQQGLKLQEREEGAMRPVDTGNFIHTVLQQLGKELGVLDGQAAVRARAEEIAAELLKTPAYSSLTGSKSGEYNAEKLVEEAATVSSGMYEQLANSGFAVEDTECRCEIPLDHGLKLYGRIDRVDACGEMVRIIDYKTGQVDASAVKYYMGLKLQLPLYLLSAAKDRRAVGAYYFPATVEYRDKADGLFRLQGFMDGSEEVVSASDTTLEPKKKSAYIEAYLGGQRIDSAMPTEDFNDFLQYSSLVARKGVKEMLSGNVAPSPAAEACRFCKMGGSCGFAVGVDGDGRSFRSVKCGEIAAVVRRERGDE